MPLTVETINALLPQTQCGECDYAGCRPYAQAIVTQGEAIDRCPPGGVRGLERLSQATGQKITPEMRAHLQEVQKPPQRAVIRESECIGCKKCIEACPVDAILGGAKHMHTVIADACTGCGLCLPPCPVDCIDLLALAPVVEAEAQLTARARQYQARYEHRLARLAKKHAEKKANYLKAKQKRKTLSETKTTRQAFIQAAIARAQQKRDKS